MSPIERIIAAGFLGVAICRRWKGEGLCGHLLYADGHQDLAGILNGPYASADVLMLQAAERAEKLKAEGHLMTRVEAKPAKPTKAKKPDAVDTMHLDELRRLKTLIEEKMKAAK